MRSSAEFDRLLKSDLHDFFPVVPFQKGVDIIGPLDLSTANPTFTSDIYNNLDSFSDWIEDQRIKAGAKYMVGGYRERRDMYRRSELFDDNSKVHGEQVVEPRSLHLGIDIWAPAGTTVYAPIGGMIHSYAFNEQFGDYGATIILQHQVRTTNFYTLYGHLSLRDIEDAREGQFITRGSDFAHFGNPDENGHWPPHLHFQVILDIGQWKGDYPGVCKPGEASSYLANSPDPSFLLPF